MRFPDPWIQFYGSDLPSPVKLVMPNRVTSTVGITKTGNKAYLDERWQDFVYTHAIEVRDTLIFTHEGGSDFKILRYKANGCMPNLDLIVGVTYHGILKVKTVIWNPRHSNRMIRRRCRPHMCFDSLRLGAWPWGWKTFTRANGLRVGTTCKFFMLLWPIPTYSVTFS
ncbi:putative B3 domain-containing protein isoform X3 [Salvia divinorum]|uniref:B3 domain-containing protein isoform X3 n=1 Tax=Salvia divinorum TaxID=28513 RepID=A0ABD1GAS6_SALDI